MKRFALALAFFLCLCATAKAQTAVVTRNVNLRPEPSAEEPPIRLLTPPTQLQLLSRRRCRSGHGGVAGCSK